VEAITAVYNPSLMNSFLAKMKGIETRVRVGAALFKRDFRRSETGSQNDIQKNRLINSLCEEVSFVYSERMKQFSWNNGKQTPIIPVCPFYNS
jgi:hypothetical protein